MENNNNLINELQSFETWIHGISGSISSTLTTLILYPIENIKTRIQIQNSIQQDNPENKNVEKEEIIQLIKKVYKKEGISGFYTGISPLLTGNFISYGIYFFWYELFKQYFGAGVGVNNSNNCLGYGGYSKAAFLSGVITTCGTNPFWVIQTRMTFQNKSNKQLQYKEQQLNRKQSLNNKKIQQNTNNTNNNNKNSDNFIKVMYHMAKNEGIQSFFKGLEASLGLVWNPIIQFIVYENLKKKLASSTFLINNKNSYFLQFLINFLAGAISKIFATIGTYPYQIVRTHTYLSKNKKISYIEIIKKIFKLQGWQGFFKGMNAKLQQSVLNAAFMLAIYEFTFKIIRFVLKNQTHKIIQKSGI